METSPYVAELRLDGGHTALDFVNTVGGLVDVPPAPEEENLRSYSDLVAWCRRVDVLPEPVAERLARSAARRPAEARKSLSRALELRVTVDSVLRPLAHERTPPQDALNALADAEREALERASLRPEAPGFEWSWSGEETLDAPLWPLAHAAVDLLTTGPLERLAPCARCRWLFIDTTKNRSRRWCSMEECGTNVKKVRYVERRRARRRSGRATSDGGS
jgi:predicted RNA-binding Zn ribbon-like protein